MRGRHGVFLADPPSLGAGLRLPPPAAAPPRGDPAPGDLPGPRRPIRPPRHDPSGRPRSCGSLGKEGVPASAEEGAADGEPRVSFGGDE